MEELLRRNDLKWSSFRLFFGKRNSMIYTWCISFAMLFMVSCSSKSKEIPKEASYTFDINQEIGYNWDYLMSQVHDKNYNNKTYTTFQKVDNYKASDNEAMGAFFIDLASKILLKESLGLTENLNSKEWTSGPLIYCGPVKYRHEKFDYVIFKSKAMFGGNTPKMDVATLGFVEYTKQYEDEDDKEKAELFYASLVEHFNAGGLTVVESNDDYTKWSDGITNVGVYLHYVMEGLVFKDSIPCINVDFESVEQFPRTQQPKQKSNNNSKSNGNSSQNTFSSAQGNFSINFPGHPSMETNTTQSANGDFITITYSFNPSNNGGYFASYTDYPQGVVTNANAQQVLENSIQSFMDNINATMTNKQIININGLNATYYCGNTNSKYNVEMCSLMRGSRYYQFGTISSGGAITKEASMNYIKSFTLTK